MNIKESKLNLPFFRPKKNCESKTYEGKATVTDTLIVVNPVCLKLLSLSLPVDYRVFNLNNSTVVQIGDVFCSAAPNEFQIEYWDGTNWIEDFDLLPHSLINIGMLFQVQF